MQIQLNTDNNVPGTDALATELEARLRRELRRFSTSITRLEVHFADLNSGAKGGADKRCMIEARLAGRRPQSVTHEAEDLGLAVAGAIDKLLAVLQTTLGRVATRRRGVARLAKSDD